jgi:predicted double-glycine peptidase
VPPRSLLRSRIFSALAIALAFSIAASAAHQPPTPVRSLKEIREDRVVIQHWDVSCGAATLATVLTYGFHDPVSERAVATGMLGGTDPIKVKVRGGFSFLDMQKFVEARGYAAAGYRQMDLDDLVKYESPIVPLNLHGFAHFVVFRGLSRDRQVRLADPAYGNRTMSVDAFERVWADGLALIVTRKDRQ